MKVLFVASEANPFAASGGLGDVMGALPKTLVKMDKTMDVSVILPLYGTVKEEYRKKMKKVADLSFHLSWRDTGASVFSLKSEGVYYLFIENHYYFNRQTLYGQADDGERFAFFSTAVVEYMKQTGEVPDILHANDWQAALTVIYLKTEYSHLKLFSKVKTVYTIHNIEYQGKYDPYILGDVFGLSAKYYHNVEYDGCINLMKGALTLSDYVSTVSPNYANELRHDFFAFGLADIISSVSGKMRGIINGIDYSYFSPEKGGDIVKPYGSSDCKEGKAINKLALQKELHLAENEDIPMLAMITRLTAGKGMDLVLRILDELLCENVQVVILGTGNQEYEDAIRLAESRHPSNMRALVKFDRVISKKLYAASDIFLMPSKSEPCGLSQMIACSYGTVPVVRSVGGLFDSIRSYGEEGANGFRFDNYNAHELLFTVKRALSLYREEKIWDELVFAAKTSDFSWNTSARQYLDMYNTVLHW